MNRHKIGSRMLAMIVFLLCFSLAAAAYAVGPANDEVVIMTVAELREAGVPLPGGTFIENGEALSDSDLIMFNSTMAIAVSVGTPNPWGYPPNSILDAALMIDERDGDEDLLTAAIAGDLRAGADTIWDMEFLMDNWDSWGPANSQPRSIAIEDNIDFNHDGSGDNLRGIVSSRKYDQSSGKVPMDVITYYVLDNDANFLRINTVVINPTDGDTYDESVNTEGAGLSTGYSLGNKGAFMFAPDPAVGAPYNQYVTTYSKDFNVSLIVPGSDDNDVWGSSGYKDSEEKTVYEPGETYTFPAFLRIDGEGSLEGTLEQLLQDDGEDAVTVAGTVYDTDSGDPVDEPILVVEKDGKTFTWIIGDSDGEYSFQLPALEDMSGYEIYALKEFYSPSDTAALSVIDEVYSPGDLWLTPTETVTVTVTDGDGDPLDARLELKGVTTPAVRYVAQTVFYTDLEDVGMAEIPVAAGEFEVQVSSGGYFLSLPETLTGDTADELSYEVEIDILVDPAGDNWFSADLHHHSNKSDGSTLPLNLVKSQLANGLDAVACSDHDSIASNPDIADYTAERDVVFLPSLEVSPSWAHFGIFPVTASAYDDMTSDNFAVNPYMDFPDMVEYVHDAGMLMVANHGYIAYGLFTAQGSGAIPGGYDEEFDLIEINGGVKAAQNKLALDKAMDLWTESVDGDGKVYYLTGGSDTHDVLLPNMPTSLYSGKGRTYVYLEDELTADSYLDALLDGHAYVTMGPILWADDLLGETIEVTRGDDLEISFDAMSVNGLSKVEIFTEGKVVADSETLDSASTDRESFTFEFTPASDTWYSIIVTDAAGKQAISNPIWIDVQSSGGGSGGSGSSGGSSSPGEVTPGTVTPRAALQFKAGVANMAYVHGYPDGTFRPNGAVTRAEVSAMFYNLLNNESLKAEGGFPDLQNAAWARQAILSLANAGVLGGYPDGTFKPGRNITRGEFAAVAAKILGLDQADAVITGQLTDVSGHWAAAPIYLLLQHGYLAGYPDGSFRPDASLTRAEAVVAINRMIGAAGVGSAATSPFSDLAKSHWAFMEIMKAFTGR